MLKSKRIYIFLFIFLFSGCISKLHLPDKQQWKESAIKAIEHPTTWIPLVGASIIAIGDWDKEISDYAREETPIFNSSKSAKDKSDTFRFLAHMEMIATAIPIDDNISLIERMVLEHVGVILATESRIPIKKITNRDRPDGNKESFPSGHSTRAFAYTGMTYQNIDALHLNPFWEYSTKGIATGFSVATAWARVEGGKHYPTDVLVGASLGNFMSIILHDVFLEKNYYVNIIPHKEGGTSLVLQTNF